MKPRASMLAALIAALFVLPAAAQEGRTPKVGEMFPDFSGQTHDGKTVSLSDYRGKVVLVDFWATWCGPCVAEMPNVRNAYAEFHDAGFDVLAISLDSKKAPLEKWYANPSTTMAWPSIYDGKGWESELGRRFGIRAIPATFLLDRQGKVAATNVRGPKLRKAIAGLLDPSKAVEDPEEMFGEWMGASAERRAELGGKIAKLFAGDQQAANQLCWLYLAEGSHGKPTAEGAALCLDILKPTLDGGRGWQELDTAALAAYLAGDAKSALEWQAEAIRKGREETKGQLGGMEMEDVPQLADIFARHALYLAKTGDAAAAREELAKLERKHGAGIKTQEHFKAASDLLADPLDS